MLNRIDGYWMEAIGSIEAFIEFTLDPLPPGTNVYANISLSEVDTLFEGKLPDPTFAAVGFIDSWTTYLPDGTQSTPQTGMGFTQNAVGVDNCATIKFILYAERVAALAQINIFTF